MSDHASTSDASASASASASGPQTIQSGRTNRISAPCGALFSNIIIQSEAESIIEGNKYSYDHGEDGVLAIFCDGSASEPYNEQHDRYTSCAVAYRENRNDPFMTRKGTPLDVKKSGNAEVCGLDMALDVGLDRVGKNDAIRTIKIFTDYSPILYDLRKLAAGQELSHSFRQETMQSIVNRDMVLARQYDITVELRWVKGHAGVLGNMIADIHARESRLDVADPENHPLLNKPPKVKSVEEDSWGTISKWEQKRREILDERFLEETARWEEEQRLLEYGHVEVEKEVEEEETNVEKSEEEKHLDAEVARLHEELGMNLPW